MVVLTDRPIRQTYRYHFVLQDAGARRANSIKHCPAVSVSEKPKGQKKCGPAIEGPHSLFTHTAKQFGRRRIGSSTSVAPKLFRSTFDGPLCMPSVPFAQSACCG
ncbi:hypothetical protein BRPE64_ACDS11190 [Caballeronia insecticola]|uniref:Uncharacterized protein n=1 Tax=Caballeronia insecticola TaxID=758793 RepID=R4WG91_9BURK|nr:hypothetical protein BRPE64_ACDS11190 [Caballeronia insecticola]